MTETFVPRDETNVLASSAMEFKVRIHDCGSPSFSVPNPLLYFDASEDSEVNPPYTDGLEYFYQIKSGSYTLGFNQLEFMNPSVVCGSEIW